MSDTAPVDAKEARRKGTKTDKDVQASANRRDIPLSAYDFFEGAYRATARARLVLVVVSAVLLALGGVVVFQGVQASLAAAALGSDLEEVQTGRAQLLKEFGTLTGFEGVSERDLIARDQELSALIQDLLATSPDFVTVLSQIKDTAEATGLTVTSIEVKPVDLPKPSGEESNGEEDGGDAAPPQSVYAVSVTATGGDFNSVVSLAELLRSTGALKEVTVANSASSAVVTGMYVAGRPSAAVEALLSELQIATRPAPPPTPSDASGENPAPQSSVSPTTSEAPAPAPSGTTVAP